MVIDWVVEVLVLEVENEVLVLCEVELVEILVDELVLDVEVEREVLVELVLVL